MDILNRGDHPEPLAEFPLVIRLPVLWGDQDAFGHVNNAVYFRWFETARICYLQQSGLQVLMDEEQLGPILASISCDYRRQLTYPDSVLVGAAVHSVGKSSLKMRHAAYSVEQQQIAADGDSVIVSFDYELQTSATWSDASRARIAEFT